MLIATKKNLRDNSNSHNVEKEIIKKLFYATNK